MLSSFIFKTCDTIVVIVFVKALPERTGTVEKAAAASSSSSSKPALTFLPHFCFLSQLPRANAGFVSCFKFKLIDRCEEDVVYIHVCLCSTI